MNLFAGTKKKHKMVSFCSESPEKIHDTHTNLLVGSSTIPGSHEGLTRELAKSSRIRGSSSSLVFWYKQNRSLAPSKKSMLQSGCTVKGHN